jgi:N-acetylmuramoyl-L-alanine amidase
MTRIKNHQWEEAKWVPSPNIGGNIVPRFVVQHYTAGYTADSAVRTLTRKGSNVSAHLTVGLNGEVIQHVPFNVKAWHAGPSSWMGYTGLNNHSIGIEIVNIGWLQRISESTYQDAYGNVRGAGEFPTGMVAARNPRVGGETYYWPRYTSEQLATIDKLTEALCSTYEILDVVSHEQIDTRGWKVDPGPAFPMNLVRRHVKSNRGDDSEACVVTASSLRVRGGPGTEYHVNGTLTRNTKVAVINRNGVWAQIGEDDWVHADYLRKI